MSEDNLFMVKPRKGEEPKEVFYRWMHENNYEMKLLTESDESISLVVVDDNDEIIVMIG